MAEAKPAKAQDPVKVDPKHYKIEAETTKCGSCGSPAGRAKNRSCTGTLGRWPYS
jgi:hypothetical protein